MRRTNSGRWKKSGADRYAVTLFMKSSFRLVVPVALFASVAIGFASDNLPNQDYPVKPVPFTAVHLDDVFWAPRIETNRVVTIPFAFEQCEKSGRMDNFDRAAKALRGEPVSN